MNVDANGGNPTPSQLFWLFIGSLAGFSAFLFQLNPVASGEAIIGVGLGLLSVLPGGLGMAMSIGRNLVAGVTAASFYGGIATKAVVSLTAIAVMCALLAAWDDTWNINEMFGFSPTQQIETPAILGGG